MRIIYIKAENIKSIPSNCEVLNFCENGNIKGKKIFPASTMILGGNGVSKSTFLEGIALLSHVNVMNPCKTDPRSVENPSYFEVKICLTFDKNTIEAPKDKKDTGSKKGKAKKDRDLRNGAKDFITFVFAAREDENSNKFSPEIASFLSSHIIDEEKINKHWCVYYPEKKKEKDLINKYLERLKFNRPEKPISANCTDIEEFSALNRATGRAKKLFELDVSKGSYKELAENSTVVFINTDLNDFGVGLNIFESPKNIRTDLPLVIHHRLPCTKAKEDDVHSLRNLDKLNIYWKKIFKHSENKDTSLSNIERGGREIVNVKCKEGDDGKIYATFEIENNYGEIKNIETLSSGENEIFFVLSTILSLELHNSVILLDEPELHLSLEKLHLYYDAIFNLAHEYDLQLIIVTQMPFILGYLANGDIKYFKGEAPSKNIIRTELRLLKAEGKENEPATKLAIKENKIEIGNYIFENNIFRYCAESYTLLKQAEDEEKSKQ